MHCHAVLKMTEGQAKIINFNDISASSWSCVIPVNTAAINLCLSKMVHARNLNIERAEEANLLYFDKDKRHLAIQCGWVHLVNSASTFSGPNCSVSFHDPLISVLSLSTLVSLSHNRIVPVSSNLISVGFQCAWRWECMLVCKPLSLRGGTTHPKMSCLIGSGGDCWPWLMAPLVSLGFTSDLNHYLHHGEPLPTPLPIKGSRMKSFGDLHRWGEACIRLDVSMYLAISPCYLVFWTHCCIFTKYDKGIEISEIGWSYKLYKNRGPSQRDTWQLPSEKNTTVWAWAFLNAKEYTLKRAHLSATNAEQASVTIYIFQT